MFKSVVLVAICASASFAATGVGRFIYSPPQPAIPYVGAVKVTPDPSSIWSWHETVSLLAGNTISRDVLVDFDGDQVMDTVHTGARVLITDVQVLQDRTSIGSSTFGSNDTVTVTLRDAGGAIWDASPGPYASGGSSSTTFGQWRCSEHLTTPLVLPVGSSLTVEVAKHNYSGSSSGPLTDVSVHLIGRLVNL